MMMNDELNMRYVKLCLIIEKILKSEKTGPINDLYKKYQRPFESLYEHWDEGDIWWDDGGMNQMTLEFKGAIDEAFVELGEPKLNDLATTAFLKEIDEYLALYSRSKRAKENQFEKSIEKEAEKWEKETFSKTNDEQKPKGKLGFLKD